MDWVDPRSAQAPIRRVCILGLGYIGLPTAAMFATHGVDVLGVDVNQRVVDRLAGGQVHIEEPGLQELVEAALASGQLRVATQPAPADAFIIAVPTPAHDGADGHTNGTGSSGRHSAAGRSDLPAERKLADLRFVRAAARSILPHLRPGNLVVLESTVPPRTTVDVLVPLIEEAGLPTGDGSTVDGGPTVEVAYCPERVLPGRIIHELVSNARTIGGVGPRAGQLARTLYASFVQGEISITDATTAEVVKLMENTYRDVNIALANELKLASDTLGIDVWEAIRLANRHPRVNILQPGPGVGGHCIAVDPWFVAQAAPAVTPLIQTARRINDSMPAHVVSQVAQLVAGIDRPTVACLGLAYKADVDDVRESPSLEVVRLLQRAGYAVRSFDPHVPLGTVEGQVGTLAGAIEATDVVVVLTDHREIRALTAAELGGPAGRPVLDTRRCLRPAALEGAGPAANGALVHAALS
jgi:UDP-N-acetyl-D-mannosaminuronic acid dehydrogenase